MKPGVATLTMHFTGAFEENEALRDRFLMLCQASGPAGKRDQP